MSSIQKPEMNIAMASTFAARCGISTYTFHLTNALRDVMTPNDFIWSYILAENDKIPGYDRDQFEGSRMQLFMNSFSRTDKDFEGIWDTLCDHPVKIFHIQHEGLIFGLDKRILDLQNKCKNGGIKTVVTMHSTPTDLNYREALLKLFPCDRMIVHTEPALKYWNNKRVVKINHGCIPLNTNVNKKDLRTKLHLDPNAFYIATTGYIGDLKGFKEIVELLPQIKKDIPNAKLLYLGGIHPATKEFGKVYVRDLARTLVKHGLSSSDVVITGWIPEKNMSDYLLTPDLYILNYKSSGIYSATGTGARIVGTRIPLICADRTGRLEELTDGVNCMKYPPERLLETIRFIMNTPTFATKIAENAYEYALQNSWDKIALQHADLYGGLLNA